MVVRGLKPQQHTLLAAFSVPDKTTDITTSHLTNPAKDAGQVIGYSHSTKLASEQVAGYRHTQLYCHPRRLVLLIIRNWERKR